MNINKLFIAAYFSNSAYFVEFEQLSSEMHITY
jgi:hypothetical protein